MSGRLLNTATTLAIAAVLSVALFVTIAVNHRTPAGQPTLFVVRSGEAFSSVKDRLAAEGLVGYPRALAVYATLRRDDRRVKAGTYLLDRGVRARDILQRLVAGDVHRVAVTIPEGFMSRQIVDVLAKDVQIDTTALADLMTDPELLSQAGIDAPSLEGYLFPDTYLIPWDSSPREIVRAMMAKLDEVFDDAKKARAEEIGLSRHEALTLASIVEAEARLKEELGMISAVYHNRLDKGMRLEADPTVAYAMGGYKGRLFYRDLEIDSPYNTYKYAGLPPGPICSPGEAAITAALYPDTSCKAIYFVAQGDGAHIFSQTLSDHLAAVKKVRQQRSSGK